MNLRLVAKKLDGGGFSVRIVSTRFGSTEVKPDEQVAVDKRVLPAYPTYALRVGGRGAVYLLVRIGRDGHAIDVATEQVNLRVAGSSQQMDQLRDSFAKASTDAVRKWTFKLPVSGREAARQEWVGRLTIDYRLPEDGDRALGKWETYIPGPRNTAIPWAEDKLRAAGAPDAMPDNGFQTLGSGPKLMNAEAG